MAVMQVISDNGDSVSPLISDQAEIARVLSKTRVRFENQPILDDIANGVDGQLLSAEDVRIAHVAPKGPNWSAEFTEVKTNTNDRKDIELQEASRNKFLGEHYHEEDESWFFLEGCATFVLRGNADKMYALACGPGDFICLPAGIRHRFDMGKSPNFRAVRFFLTDPGFVGTFTDEVIPTYLHILDDLRMMQVGSNN
jgi:1,2-dihydroxy-3-keto-5-methylthiopentene dioxygenase